ncbi:MAG: hypothetical protein HQL01_00915 [Nitrospirae bacterium]|nr:hypothetical protein [Nitrospirota bacterium]
MECGTHIYDNITRPKVDLILQKLTEGDAAVSGPPDGPWDIDTRNSGVKLRAGWDAANSKLSVTVTDKKFYVPCEKVWTKIDALMAQV